MSTEAINVSASSTAIGVALKAPAMFLRHLFYMIASLFEITFDF